MYHQQISLFHVWLKITNFLLFEKRRKFIGVENSLKELVLSCINLRNGISFPLGILVSAVSDWKFSLCVFLKVNEIFFSTLWLLKSENGKINLCFNLLFLHSIPGSRFLLIFPPFRCWICSVFCSFCRSSSKTFHTWWWSTGIGKKIRRLNW